MKYVTDSIKISKSLGKFKTSLKALNYQWLENPEYSIVLD